MSTGPLVFFPLCHPHFRLMKNKQFIPFSVLHLLQPFILLSICWSWAVPHHIKKPASVGKNCGRSCWLSRRSWSDRWRSSRLPTKTSSRSWRPWGRWVWTPGWGGSPFPCRGHSYLPDKLWVYQDQVRAVLDSFFGKLFSQEVYLDCWVRHPGLTSLENMRASGQQAISLTGQEHV